MRLIDAEPLEKKFKGWIERIKAEYPFAKIGDADGVESCLAELEDAPTVSLEYFSQWNDIANHPPVQKRILKNVCGKPERMVSNYVLVWSDKFQICTYGRYYEDDGWSIHDVMMTNEDIVEQRFTKWMNMPKPTKGDAE